MQFSEQWSVNSFLSAAILLVVVLLSLITVTALSKDGGSVL